MHLRSRNDIADENASIVPQEDYEPTGMGLHPPSQHNDMRKTQGREMTGSSSISSDRKPAIACAFLLLAAFFWGAGNVANKTVLEDIGPLTAVALRSLIACAMILPLALKERRRAPACQAWMPSAMVVSLLFAGATVLQQIAYLSTTVTNASFLVNIAGVMTPVLAWLVLGQRPGLRIVVAAPLTLAGAFFMTGMTFRLDELNTGDVYCLASALAYAAWMIALGRHAQIHSQPFATSLMQFLVAAVVVLPISAMVEVTTLEGLRGALPELLMLGVFSTAVAFAIQTYALRFISASTAAVLVSAESLFGAAGAVLILNEAPTLAVVSGAALILGAILLVATADHGAETRLPEGAQRTAQSPNNTNKHPARKG